MVPYFFLSSVAHSAWFGHYWKERGKFQCFIKCKMNLIPPLGVRVSLERLVAAWL